MRVGGRLKKVGGKTAQADGQDASRWYERLHVQKLTLLVLNCAHALWQSFHD